MAFVNRSERKLMLFNPAPEVGPGTYIGQSEYKPGVNYAPFSSSTERVLDKLSPVYTPGPGSYLEVYQKPQKTIVANFSPAFASQKSRFDNKSQSIPGPGTYNVSSKWSEKRTFPKAVNMTNWVRLPSAPSIPGQMQGYGYDETMNGDLVMHRGPNIISGSGEDSVGPGHYNPKFVDKAKGPLWHKSAVKRSTFLNKSSVPGPGSYVPKSTTPKYKLKPSAVFASNCKRPTEIYGDDSSEDGNPGPGNYAAHSTFTPSPVRSGPQNFGSGCERFKSTTPEPLRIGPGYYNVPSPNFRKKIGDSKAPFSSTNLRFQNNVDLNPGPGSYRNVDVQKKVWGKQGVFGSTEKRFYGRPLNNIPGPGSYAIEKNVGLHNSAKHKGHSVFLSKCKRINSASPINGGPAPGSYEITSSIGHIKPPPVPLHPVLVREDQPTKLVGFNAQADRFGPAKGIDLPGPGSYKIIDNKAIKSVIVFKDPRFKDNKKDYPGPGSYNREENERWNKRTYNVLFE